MNRNVSLRLRLAAFILVSSLSGAALLHAWSGALWALAACSVLVIVWLCTSVWNISLRRLDAPHHTLSDSITGEAQDQIVVERLLLNVLPIPLIAIESGTPRALNRAARSLFDTDDRILPCPPAILDQEATHLTHANRVWRIDRVSAYAPQSDLVVAALIDFEQDKLAAEVTASTELIEILSHELMNGLAPIVSLAESARAAAQRQPAEQDLLLEILGPLSRRAAGLHRFAASYHALAKLPEPELGPVVIADFMRDMDKAFSENWPVISLQTQAPDGVTFSFDPDQIHQAIWAILQNAAEAVSSLQEKVIKITVTQNESTLRFAIRDSGEGITAQSASYVFRPFYTTKSAGSGIGLALARQIARAHGGNLDLASHRPAEFVLTLPLQKSAGARFAISAHNISKA